MLNKEAQEIHSAHLKFEVSGDFRELRKAVNQCEYITAQYYINNTCLDLTVMDVFGLRQTLPRKKDRDRTGDRVLKVVREYRFIKTLEEHSREFFDEIENDDGPILMALKDLEKREDIFRKKGFTTEYSQSVNQGHLLIVTFEIDEKDITLHKTVDSTALGITVSRLKREHMPANPVYAAINSGTFYNPFKKFLNPEYKMTRIFANYHDTIKEQYWYNLADTPVEVEYTRIKELEEGIHVQAFIKQEDVEVAQNVTIKFVKFDEALNKNGFFTSPRDAMLGSNTQRSDREKDVELKERLRRSEIEALEVEERLNKAKRELMVLRQEADELNHYRQTKVLELQHDNTLELEMHKKEVAAAEYRLTDSKLRLSAAQMTRDVVEFHQDIELNEQKRIMELSKLQASAIKHVQDLEMANFKHRATLVEMDRAGILSEAQHVQKLTMVEVDIATSATAAKRKALEDNTKMVSTVVGGLTTFGKLIL